MNFRPMKSRFSTDQSAKVRLTAGAFYSDMELTERVDFSYPGNKLVDAWGAGSGNGFGFAPNYNYPYDWPGRLPTRRRPLPRGHRIFRNDILRTDEQMGRVR